MPTTATTIKEGHRYELGDLVIWYPSKPREGRRVRFFVKSSELTLVHHIDRPAPSVDNEEETE